MDKRREEIHLILHGPLQTIVTTNECGPTVARSLNFSKVHVWDFMCVNLLEFENKPNKVQLEATGLLPQQAWGREDFNGMRMKWEQLWCVCDGKGIKGKKEALRTCL